MAAIRSNVCVVCILIRSIANDGGNFGAESLEFGVDGRDRSSTKNNFIKICDCDCDVFLVAWLRVNACLHAFWAGPELDLYLEQSFF